MSNKYTIKGKIKIVENEKEKYIIKEKDNNINIQGLNNYLKSRNFYNFPELISYSEKENYYEFVEDFEIPKEQKLEDMINLLANLHHKTSYYKEVSEDKFKEIYDKIESNIIYLQNYYNNLYNKVFKKVYMSPDEYLFIKNFYKINSALVFCDKELSVWYDKVKKETKFRVCVVHNDLKLEHYLKSEKETLISWEKYLIDMPILDIIKLYKNEYMNDNFKPILDKYLEKFPLYENEKKLLFILISIPPKIVFDINIFEYQKNIGLYIQNRETNIAILF